MPASVVVVMVAGLAVGGSSTVGVAENSIRPSLKIEPLIRGLALQNIGSSRSIFVNCILNLGLNFFKYKKLKKKANPL